MEITTKAFIARDKDESLSIYFGKKPYKGEYAWSFYDHLSMNFADIPDKNLFPEVKWEDETPTEVEIKIVDSSQKQTQKKFDPKSLKPFDKVLVRNDYDIWQVEFFSHICQHDPKGWCQCSGDSYYFCIPYDEETKHLVGTTQDAPQHYRYWED